MTLSAAEIDQIVQNVLRQIQPSTEHAADPKPAATPGVGGRVVHLADRIVTAQLLADSVSNAGTITLAKGAIVTPAARDYLKEKQIRIASQLSTAVDKMGQGQSESRKSVSTVPRWLGLQVATSGSLQTALSVVRKSHAGTFQIQAADSTAAAAETAISEVNRGGAAGILILTDRPALAACLANRCSRVRAVVLKTARDQADLQELNANVVCLPERGPSVADYLQMLRAIVASPGGNDANR